MSRMIEFTTDEMYDGELVIEADLRELIGNEPPSCYHEGNCDPYADLQNTQELYHIVH